MPRTRSGQGRARRSNRHRARGRGEERDGQEDEAKSRATAERLAAVEVAARSMFRPDRKLNVEKLEAFLTDLGGDEALEMFQESKTQAAKLGLVWTFNFDPPLTDVEMLGWEDEYNGSNGDNEESERKAVYLLTAEELQDFVVEQGAPEELAQTLLDSDVDAKTLRDFTAEDVREISDGNVSWKRWLRRLIQEVTPTMEDDSSSRSRETEEPRRRLLAAVRDGNLDKAAELLAVMRQANRGNGKAELGSSSLNKFLEKMEQESIVNSDLMGGREKRSRNRDNELRRRLGAMRPTQEGKEVTFLEVTIDSKEDTMRQVKDLLSPLKTSSKYDAAHNLRQELEGYEATHPIVRLRVPEGLDSAFARLDLVLTKLRLAKELTVERSEAFNHLRSIMRNYKDQLQPLEQGFLAIGGMKMIISDVVSFKRLFKPDTYTESIPDAVIAKLKLCAKRKEKYLVMQAAIQEALDRAKRPVVVQAGYKRDRQGNDRSRASPSGWKQWGQRLVMNVDPAWGARPQYRVLKVLKQRMYNMKADGQFQHNECRKCALYHSGERCDVFTYPAFRSAAFKDLWRAGHAANALPNAIEEWNSRPQRQSQYRVDTEGKSVVNPTQKGPGL